MCYQALDCIKPGMWAHEADGQGKAPWHSLPWHLSDKGLHRGQDFLFHRPFAKAASSRVLSSCQSLSALHSQCLSPHSLAAGGVRSLGKSQAWGCFLSEAPALSAPPAPFPEALTASIHPSKLRLPQEFNPDSDSTLSISEFPKGTFLIIVGAQQWGSSAPPGKGNALPRNSRCWSLPPAPRNELLLFHLPWRQEPEEGLSCRLGNLGMAQHTKIL